MEEAKDPHQLFFTNLLLLGFDPVAWERKDRIPYNKDMFQLPNKKGFETVMHFLFQSLDPVQCKEEFRFCWPVSDKKQEHQFRKVCQTWLSSVAQEDEDAHLPRIMASLFMSCSGEKIYTLLVQFSTFILLKCSRSSLGGKRRDEQLYPTLVPGSQNIGPGMAKALKCSCIRHQQHLLKSVHQTTAAHQQWQQYTGELVRTYRGLVKKVKDLQRHVRNEQQKTGVQTFHTNSPSVKRRAIGSSEYDYDIQSVQRAQRVQKVRELWKAVDMFLGSTADNRAMVDSLLEGTLDKYRIDGEQLNMKVPGLLLTECEQEIQRRNIDNVYQGGKLNLLSVINLWNLSLHLYIERFHKVGVPNFEESVAVVTSQVHTHQAHLANAQAMQEELEKKFIPNLQRSVAELRDEIEGSLFQDMSPDSIRTTSLGLGLLPKTPPVTFDPLDSTTPASQALVQENLQQREEPVTTPDGATELLENIQRKMVTREAAVVQGSPVYGPKLGITTAQPNNKPRLMSQVPVRIQDVEADKHGNKQHTHMKAAPAPALGRVRALTPRAQLPANTRRPPKPATHTTADSVRLTSSGTSLHELPPQQQRAARRLITTQVAPPARLARGRVGQGAERHAAKKSHQRPVKVERHADTVVSFTQPPRAHDVLAEQIADAVMQMTGGEEREVVRNEDKQDNDGNLIDPLQQPTAALDYNTGFKQKDKIKRSPERPAAWSTGRWQDSAFGETLTTESQLPNDTQPASSTSHDSLALKLFSTEDESDPEDHIMTVGGDSTLHHSHRADPPRSHTPPCPTSHPHHTTPPRLSNNPYQSSPMEHPLRGLPESPVGMGPPSYLSSISPRSQASSRGARDMDKRHSTLIGELDPAPRHHHAGFSGNTSPHQELEQVILDLSNTLQGSVLSDTGEEDEGAIGTSILGELQRLPSAELYQSLLDTKTSMLPTRHRARHVVTGQDMHRQPSPVLPSASHQHKPSSGNGVTGHLRSGYVNVKHRTMPSESVRHQPYGSEQQSGESVPSRTYPAQQNSKSHEELEESIRVIQFQNGSFSEFLDKSPAKAASSKETEELLNFSSNNSNKLHTVAGSEGIPVESIIARYKRIKKLQEQQSYSPVMLQPSTPAKPLLTPPKSDVSMAPYLVASPGKISPKIRRQTLNFDAGNDNGGSDQSLSPQPQRDQPVSTTTGGGMLQGYLDRMASETGGLLDISPPHFTDSPEHVKQPALKKTPRAKALRTSMIPMSPLTDLLHSAPDISTAPHHTSPSSQAWPAPKHIQNFNLCQDMGILGENESILLPSSPPLQETTEPATGMLINI